MSKVVPAFPEHASLAQCPEWVSLPRRACLEAICFGGHCGLSRQLEQKFFYSGTCNQVTVLACACERQSEQFEQGKTGHMNYTFVYSRTKEGISGKPSTFFLAAFCLMQ